MKRYSSRFPVYRILLSLYPAPYRGRYGEEILRTTADMLDEAKSPLSKLVIWMHIVINLPINIGRQQARYVGTTMINETPSYIRRNSVIAVGFVLPFMLTIMANGATKVVAGHDLYGSWLWRAPILSVWALYLPEAALLLALTTYIVYLAKDNSAASRFKLSKVINVRHIWPIILPAVLAFGILFFIAFHDSVRCWVYNPTRSITHVSQAWQCTVKNQSLEGFTHL